MPDEPEALALLALMLLHDSRRDARVDEAGELVLLEDQDRSRWDREAIAEGGGLVERALALGGPGPYALQAFIAAEHGRAGGPDWARVAGAYDRLLARRRAARWSRSTARWRSPWRAARRPGWR